jgi:hypothetical protein
MSENQLVSVSEAARLVGRDRKTIYRDYLSRGRLSATTDATGKKVIAISELIRVFGDLSPSNATAETVAKTVVTPQTETPSETAKMAIRLAALEAENAALLDRLKDKDKHIDDLRNSVRLLEHKPAAKKWWPW